MSADDRDPLDVVAGKILAFWKKAEDQRLSAALLLKEAKERVEAGEDGRFTSFLAWCRHRLPGRSDREIRRLLQIANAPDPKLALNEMRAKAREHTRLWRERQDSRESTGKNETGCGFGAEPRDVVSDRKTFEQLLGFLADRQHLPLMLRISMALRLVDALGVDAAELQDHRGRTAA